MKKLCILGLLVFVRVFGSAQQQFNTLDSAIREAARYLEWRLPIHSAVAVISITSDDKRLSKTIVDELVGLLVNNNKLRVVDRDKDSDSRINDEIARSLSGAVSDADFISIGRQIGAQFLISGSVEKREPDAFRLRIQAVSVETTQIQGAENFDFKDPQGTPRSPDTPHSALDQRTDNNSIKVDYLIKQITYQPTSTIQEGALYIQIGFKAYSSRINIEGIARVVDTPPPASLRPKNICFVIDISGSMGTTLGTESRLNWIKQAFEVIINTEIRDRDFISLVVFNDAPSVIFEQWQIKNAKDREKCLDLVKKLNPGGGTAIGPGLYEGYRLVAKSFRDNFINRVVLLTDGETGDQDKTLSKKYVREYMNRGISTISTIALSKEADRVFMTDIALEGGGISLFIDQYEPPVVLANRIGWLITGAQEDIRKEIPCNANISLTPHRGVVLQEASPQELTGFSENQARYRLSIRDREYKTLWVKVYLSQGAVKNGDILQIGIDDSDDQGNPVIQNYQITLGMDPVQISSFKQIKVLSMYHAFQ